MIKKISNMRGVVIRKPIDIDEPIFLDDHIPYAERNTGVERNVRVIAYPDALNFTKTISNVDYVVNTHFSENGNNTLLSQFRDLILSQKLTDDLL